MLILNFIDKGLSHARRFAIISARGNLAFRGLKVSSRKNFRFDQAITELESLVEKLESGELSLEDSLKQFEKGIKLTRECQQALESAEQKVTTLVQESGLAEIDEDFDGEASDEDEFDEDELDN